MKILFVVSGLGSGGAEDQVILLSKELARLGHRTGIYCLSARTGRLPELGGSGVEVQVDRKRRPIDPAVLWRLSRHLRRWRPDLVHAFGFDADVYSRLGAAGAGIPVINSERTDDQRVSRVQHLGYRLTSLLCDGVVANTRAGAEFARRLHRVGEDRVDVLWNAVDLESIDARVACSPRPAVGIFPRIYAGGEVKRLCMVVSIRPVNDHPLALRALKRLLAEDRRELGELAAVGGREDEPRRQAGGAPRRRTALHHVTVSRRRGRRCQPPRAARRTARCISTTSFCSLTRSLATLAGSKGASRQRPSSRSTITDANGKSGAISPRAIAWMSSSRSSCAR